MLYNLKLMVKGHWKNIFDEEFLARLRRLHLIAKHLTARWSRGARRSRLLGDGLEFADHRAYSFGDDIRFIDWPYFARMEKLLLRMFHEHSEAEVAILVDCSGSMAPAGRMEKFHYALRAAAALTYVAMGSGQAVTLLPFAAECRQSLHTGRNRGRIFQALDFLADIEPGGRTNLLGCLEQFARRYPPAATVVILSDLMDCAGSLGRGLDHLSVRGCDVAVLQLYRPCEARPAPGGSLMLRHAETSEQMPLDVTQDLLAAYRRRWDDFQHRCRRACLEREAIYVPASTTIDMEGLILQTLRHAGVLRE